MWVICHQCQFPFIKRGSAHKLLIITKEINLSRFPWGKLSGWSWDFYDAVIVRHVSNVKPTYNDRKTKILNSWLPPPKSEWTDMEKKKAPSVQWSSMTCPGCPSFFPQHLQVFLQERQQRLLNCGSEQRSSCRTFSQYLVLSRHSPAKTHRVNVWFKREQSH